MHMSVYGVPTSYCCVLHRVWIFPRAFIVDVTDSRDYRWHQQFNISLDRPLDPHCVQFTALLSTYGLVQRASHPTLYLCGLLYVLIMRDGGHCQAPAVRDVGLSGHYLLQLSINITRLPPVFWTVTSRHWKQFNFNSFSTKLSLSALCAGFENLPTDVHDVNVLATQYNELLIRLVHQHAPLQVITYHVRPSNEWFGEECRKMKAQVRKLERRYKLNNKTADRRIWTSGYQIEYCTRLLISSFLVFSH